MDISTSKLALAAASGGASDPLYVDDVFNTFLYEGTGNARTINNGIDLAGEGGLVWFKSRSQSGLHYQYDTERGAGKSLASNATYTEQSRPNTLTSFNSNGFTLGTDGDTNFSSREYVSWSFRKTPGFFDVVTYTGTGSAQNIAHSLGSVPGMIVIKRLNSGASWTVYHRNVGPGQYVSFNTTSSVATQPAKFDNTGPTSTHFTVGTASDTNGNGDSFVAYIFAHDDQSFGTNGNESIIKCGSYYGNSNADGPHIDLGFEPQWVMIKNVDLNNTYTGWAIFDNMRGVITEGDDRPLQANNESQEAASPNTAGNYISFTPTGFSLIGGWYATAGSSNQMKIYVAIRRPNKPPESATEVFAIDTGSGSSTTPTYDSGFPVDFAMRVKLGIAYPSVKFGARLTGEKVVDTQYNGHYGSYNQFVWDSNLGYGKTDGADYTSYMFKRAPGFMDVVSYKGTSSNKIESHSLTVIPELIIVKRLDNPGQNWTVYAEPITESRSLLLNEDTASIYHPGGWNSTVPTSTYFTVGTDGAVNGSPYQYIAYLFATLPGISKVGSYSGSSGANISVDCGFSSGARFVMVKRTDATGDWYVWDTNRGINTYGNDPYFILNDTLNVTNTNYIAALTQGFSIMSSAPAALNTTGGTYLFLAIA